MPLELPPTSNRDEQPSQLLPPQALWVEEILLDALVHVPFPISIPLPLRLRIRPSLLLFLLFFCRESWPFLSFFPFRSRKGGEKWPSQSPVTAVSYLG
jgi:hypothetical protein